MPYLGVAATFRLLEWVTPRLRNFPAVTVGNFTHDFADGRAYLAILAGSDRANAVDGRYAPTPDPAVNLRR